MRQSFVSQCVQLPLVQCVTKEMPRQLKNARLPFLRFALYATTTELGKLFPRALHNRTREEQALAGLYSRGLEPLYRRSARSWWAPEKIK